MSLSADARPRAARSVHLSYPSQDTVAFYQEIQVTESVPGSYFMACGFADGYFGVQELKAGEPGLILFSVWDPHEGDHPEAVPEEQKVGIRYRGEGVTFSRFGGEGTGVKSFFSYDWKPGETLRFLVTQRMHAGRTSYSGFFYRNDEKRWMQVATLDTPRVRESMTNLYSFVEDFRRDGKSAQQRRSALFGNGWTLSAEGKWSRITRATFTADDTPLDSINAVEQDGRFALSTGGETEKTLDIYDKLRLKKPAGERPELPVLRGEAKLIPLPVELKVGSGDLVLSPSLSIRYAEGWESPAAYFASVLEPILDNPPALQVGGSGKGDIHLKQMDGMAEEAYRLSVRPDGVSIMASTSKGALNGIHAFLQLLPPQVLGGVAPRGVQVAVPAVEIADAPQFSWRGLMLDPCRHFLPVDRVKRMLDMMALQRMSVMHFHLTEDQGWRIEIKKYPRLTEVGSKRKETPLKGNRNVGDGIPYGPYFYTQAELRDLVAYAAERGITIVPEIELPGHSMAALAAYPHLGCTGGPYEVRTQWGVESHIYCAGQESTFEFLQDVLLEVMDIFPSKTIHVGGDEAPKDKWKGCDRCQKRIKDEGLHDEHELQSCFITRMENFLRSHGRNLIGWDEILEGGLAPNAKVMSWRGEQGGIHAAKTGHYVVMSPTSHCYLDYYQSREPGEPEAIGGYNPLPNVYSYHPVPKVLTEEESEYILGVQGNLWSEYFFSPDQMEYQAFPRASAIAEVGWTPKAQKDFTDFRVRLDHHLRRLDAFGLNYRDPGNRISQTIGTWKPGETNETFQTKTWPLKDFLKGPGTVQIQFQYTGGEHRLDIAWARITANRTPVAEDRHLGITGFDSKDSTYTLEIDAFDPEAEYALEARVRSDGGANSQGEIFLYRQIP